ncbi:hypothetical protein [Photobacterium halotolerans]|uniref:hypothetical protein n=1 Tax=Photobacterium halotolerans TaxID=265726 RepID=UPI0012DF06C6|nr:hypothetical protein [Photobacterium halotolerans]
MKIQILDEKKEGNATCYLCKAELKEYIESLPEDYKDWDIQRGIISNSYLDKMIDTVLEDKHIPPIVLISDNLNLTELTIEDFNILDGLQRTYRLKVIFDSILFLKSKLEEDDNFINIPPLSLSRNHSDEIQRSGASASVIRRLISEVKSGNTSLDDIFKSFQWFEVWVNLTKPEQVEKMIILNAGHKNVSIKHQAEIIFSILYPELRSATSGNLEIIRERDINLVTFSKKRSVGQFHLSHLVSSLASLELSKPVTLNSNFIQKLQNDDITLKSSYIEIKELCKFLADFDIKVQEQFGDESLRWLGKDVVLSGIFGAIGKRASELNHSLTDEMGLSRKIIFDNIKNLNITDFESTRNNVDLSKVNIGDINKKAVYTAIYDFLNTPKNVINWGKYFKEGFNND